MGATVKTPNKVYTRLPQEHRDNNAPDPWESTRTVVVGVGAFSGSLRGLKLVPSKWCCLVPGERRDGAQSYPPALIRVLRKTPQRACGAYPTREVHPRGR